MSIAYSITMYSLLISMIIIAVSLITMHIALRKKFEPIQYEIWHMNKASYNKFGGVRTAMLGTLSWVFGAFTHYFFVGFIIVRFGVKWTKEDWKWSKEDWKWWNGVLKKHMGNWVYLGYMMMAAFNVFSVCAILSFILPPDK